MAKIINISNSVYETLISRLRMHGELDIISDIESNTTHVKDVTEDEMQQARYIIGLMKQSMQR